MNRKLPTRFFTLFLVAIGLHLPSAANAGEDFNARVLTRNLYLGADVFDALAVSDPAGIPAAAGTVLAQIIASDFQSRAALLADEIQRSQPHAVGLQEVFNIQALPQIAGDPIALDYLAILLAELEARGQQYDVAVNQTNLDLTLPVLVPVPGGLPLPYLGNISDHDVILVRHNVAWANPAQGHYVNVASSPFPAPFDFVIPRGWVAVDLVFSGSAYRFVNTHLDVESDLGDGGLLQTLQAVELLNALEQLRINFSDLPEVVVGDFNSDQDDPPCSHPLCLVTGLTNPYDILSNPAMFLLPFAPMTDIWTLRHNDRNAPGDTCCFLTLADPVPADISRRVDLIWTRGSVASGTTVRLQGDDDKRLTDSGLFASDHLGVMARTTLMPGP